MKEVAFDIPTSVWCSPTLAWILAYTWLMPVDTWSDIWSSTIVDARGALCPASMFIWQWLSSFEKTNESKHWYEVTIRLSRLTLCEESAWWYVRSLSRRKARRTCGFNPRGMCTLLLGQGNPRLKAARPWIRKCTRQVERTEMMPGSIFPQRSAYVVLLHEQIHSWEVLSVTGHVGGQGIFHRLKGKTGRWRMLRSFRLLVKFHYVIVRVKVHWQVQELSLRWLFWKPTPSVFGMIAYKFQNAILTWGAEPAHCKVQYHWADWNSFRQQ